MNFYLTENIEWLSFHIWFENIEKANGYVKRKGVKKRKGQYKSWINL